MEMEGWPKSLQIQMHLNNCESLKNLYQHPRYKDIYYTDGIKMMYCLCEAHWLVLELLANCKALSKDNKFIFIEVLIKELETDCSVVYRDGDNWETVLWEIEYKNIDFPLYDITDFVTFPAIEFHFRDNILRLPWERE